MTVRQGRAYIINPGDYEYNMVAVGKQYEADFHQHAFLTGFSTAQYVNLLRFCVLCLANVAKKCYSILNFFNIVLS